MCTILNIANRSLQNILVLFAILCLAPTFANYQYHYTHISTNAGLSNSTINSIYRDNCTLWVGTRQGLNRLNEDDIKCYYSTNSENSLPSSNIIFVTGTSSEEIIISTQLGVVRYNSKEDNFIAIEDDSSPLTATLFCHSDGDLYLVSSRGLYRYNDDDSVTLCFDLRGETQYNSRFNTIIEGERKGVFILGTRFDGLWQIDINSNTLKRLEWYPHQTVIAMSRGEGNNNFWITPYNTGVYNYTLKGEYLTHFDSNNSELQNNLTLALSVVDTKLFIGSNGSGLYIVDIPSRRLNSVGYNTLYEPTIESVKCFCNSTTPNQIWVGSDDGVFDLSAVLIRAYGKSTNSHNKSDDKLGLSSRAVNYIFKDEDVLWIGTDGGGINRFDSKSRTFRHYPSTKPLKIVHIAEWSPNELLISAYSRGLFIFDKRSGSLRPTLIEEHKNNMDSSIPTNLIVREDKIYMFGNKAVIYDRTSKETTTLPLVEMPYPSPMTPINITDTDAYIISKRALYRLSFETNQIEHLFTPDLDNGFINSASIDSKGRVWIGHDNGLVIYDLESGENEVKRSLKGLRVNSIAITSNDGCWIASENTLYRYYSSDDTLQSYNSQIGFAPNVFNGKANIEIENGGVVMGGGSGIIIIPDGIEPIAPHNLELKVDKIVVNGESFISDEPNSRQSNELFNLPYTNNVQLIIKHNGDNPLNKYKFRYSINNENFVESDGNVLNLGSLSGGRKHSLSVAYLNIDGNWTEPQQLINFVVPNIWYLRWYYITLLLLLLIGLTQWQTHRYRMAKKDQYQRRLSSHVKRIDEEKIELLTNINHELRTPLTLMRAPLLQVVKSLPDSSEESRLSQLALKQVMRMKHIVDMILDINKIDSGNQILYKTATNVDEWLLDFINNFEYEAQQHNIKLITTFTDEPKYTMLDRGKMELVVTNLISNAIKFSKENSSITIHCSISEQECIRICVKDQGIGIKVEPNRLFDAFYQENTNGVGTGLGLSYARSIVELHDGEIGCANNVGETGATFFFEIPILECPEEALNLSTPQQYRRDDHNEVDLSNYTVVIVEDNPSVREYLTVELRRRFKTTYSAANGMDGLQLIRKVKPNIVISDIMMPVMNGYEMCQTLKNESEISHIPVILLTAYVSPDNKLTGYKMGADNYITKPFDMEYLFTVVGNTLTYRSQVLISSKSSSGVIDSKDATFSAYDERFMTKINNIVEQEISNPQLNVDMIASAMAMSRTSLYNKMKSVADVSVRDYILRIRMERARELLSDFDLPISEIADKVGFSDQRYFSTTFKQHNKQTPSEYRNRLIEVL